MLKTAFLILSYCLLSGSAFGSNNLPALNYVQGEDRESHAMIVAASVATSATMSSLLANGEVALSPLVFEEPEGHTGMALASVMAAKRMGLFSGIGGGVLNKGLSKQAIWMSFNLDGKGVAESGLNLYLLIGNALLDRVAVYVNGEPFGDFPHLGLEQPFSERAIAQPKFIVPIHLAADDRLEFLIRVQSSTSLRVPINLFTEKAFLEEQFTQQFIFGAYYGLIFIMCIYYFVVYFSGLEKVYLYFSASLASLVLLELQFDGYLFQYVYPTAPQASFSSFVCLVSGVYVFAFMFTRHFLSTKRTSLNLDRAFSVLIIYGLFLAFSGFVFSSSTVMFIGIPFCIAGGSACLLAGAYNILKGYRSGYFYLAAIGAVTLGSLVFLAMFVGLVPSNWFTEGILKFTTVIEVLLLSFALTDRIRIIRQEKAALKDVMVKNLREQNRAKDEFLAIVSHELRTPMNGVQGALDLVQNQPLKTEIRDYIEMASLSAASMVTLINDILDFTELQNNRVKTKQSVFGLATDLSKLFNGYVQSNKNQRVEYRLEIDSAVRSHYKGDSQKVFKVIKHLLNNAVKFTEEGSITLRVTTSDSGNYAQQINLAVIDTGAGIAEDKHSVIFDAFRLEDVSLSRAQGGIGLGLSITRKLLSSIGGTLDFTSTKGRGSEFIASFPLNVPTQDEMSHIGERKPTLTLTDQPKLNILVVEDNIVNQKVLVGILNKLGHKTAVASNGQEGVSLVESEAVDIVLMDCQMPVMDGLQATREIRKNVAFENLPIIAVTANATSEDETYCLAAGMNDFMAKPVNKGAIKRVVDKWALKSVGNKRSAQG